MLSLLSQLFHRYAFEHVYFRLPGFALLATDGAVVGYLDQVTLAGNRIRAEGWCIADKVALVYPGGRVEMVPNLHRSDVAISRGDDNAALGFSLDMPFLDGRIVLSLETGGRSLMQPLPAFGQHHLRTARRRMIWPFLRDGIRGLPHAIRWLISRDPRAKAGIKAALRFSEQAPRRNAISAQLFLDSHNADDLAASSRPLVPLDLLQTPVTIVLPVFNAFDLLGDVLDRVQRHTDLPWRMVVIEDCSSDPRVRPFLRDWVTDCNARDENRVILIENASNQGFIRSVNTALETARAFGDHVILLNSDALVPRDWASRLIRPLLAHDDVATVTPMSNDAEICSVPVICQKTGLTPGEADRIDLLARGFHPDAGLAVAPTGVGFCMAMNRRYLAKVPELDTSFGRGYGEEVDWCQKVRALGGRHLALPGLFVEHRGGTSFGSSEKLKLVLANNAIISRRYPQYDAEVQAFIREDPLATPRLALAIAWAAGRLPPGTEIPIYLAHNLGGGASDYLDQRIADGLAAQVGDEDGFGGAAVVLRVGGTYRWRIELHCAAGVTHGVTQDTALMKRLLAPLGKRHIVYSCGVGDSDPITLPDILIDLADTPDSRISVLFHDYFPVSPSYTLLDSSGVYCGVPAPGNDDPVHQARRPDGSLVSLAQWRSAWGRLMRAADERVVFSSASRDIVARAWPEVSGSLTLRPHKMLHPVPAVARPPRSESKRPVIGVLGNIGYQKGAAVLRDLSTTLAVTREADLVVIGNLDPAYALAAPAIVHGSYLVRDLPQLIDRYDIDIWLIPSIWPETFSYTTHEAIMTGLPVWAFDIGAQADAVRMAVQNGAKGGILARPEAGHALVWDLCSLTPEEKIGEGA